MTKPMTTLFWRFCQCLEFTTMGRDGSKVFFFELQLNLHSHRIDAGNVMLQKFSVFPDLMEPSSIFVLGGQNPSKQQITKGDLVTVENHYFWIFLGRLLEVHFIWPTGDSIYIQYLTLCWHRWHRSRQCRHGHLWQQAGQLGRWNERCSLVPEAWDLLGLRKAQGMEGWQVHYSSE